MRFELNIKTEEMGLDDLADTLAAVAAEMRQRKAMPADEVGNIYDQQGTVVGFWEAME